MDDISRSEPVPQIWRKKVGALPSWNVLVLFSILCLTHPVFCFLSCLYCNEWQFYLIYLLFIYGDGNYIILHFKFQCKFHSNILDNSKMKGLCWSWSIIYYYIHFKVLKDNKVSYILFSVFSSFLLFCLFYNLLLLKVVVSRFWVSLCSFVLFIQSTCLCIHALFPFISEPDALTCLPFQSVESPDLLTCSPSPC